MSLVAETAGRLFREHAEGRTFQPIGGHPSERPLDFAYDVQDRFVSLLTESGLGGIAGYKIGLTTTRMQQMCGIDHPIAGAVLSQRVYRSPVTVAAENFGRLGVECELAVRLSRDFGANTAPGLEDIRASIATVATAFELVDDRNADYKALDLVSLVADNSWNSGIVLGPDQAVTAIDDLEGILEVKGAVVDRGRTSDVLGNPLKAVAWLATHLARRGRRIGAGQWIMTGSVIPTKFARPGEHYSFALGGLPKVELSVT